MKRRSQHTRATTTTRRYCDDDKDNEEKLQLGRFAIEWKRKKRRIERADHREQTANERTTRLTDRWSTKCAQRAPASPLYTLELAPVLAQIGLLSFVHSVSSSVRHGPPRALLNALCIDASWIFQIESFTLFNDSRFNIYHRPLHGAPSFSLALLSSLLSSALHSSTSSCLTFLYIWENFDDKGGLELGEWESKVIGLEEQESHGNRKALLDNVRSPAQVSTYTLINQ